MSLPLQPSHETSPQRAIHTCWPHSAKIWGEYYEGAQEEFGAFLTALGTANDRGHAVRLVVYCANDEAEASARKRLPKTAQFVRAEYGDVWARDTGPVFVRENGELVGVRFGFNGWGGKFNYPEDQTIGGEIIKQAGAKERLFKHFTTEGGALEFDGEGTMIATRHSILNTNRQDHPSQEEAEAIFKEALGIEKVIWLDDGLHADHTDGHIDNVARFARPGVVVCQAPWGTNDPNRDRHEEVARVLSEATDAKGRKLEVRRIPSPGLFTNAEGEIFPASHMNWVIGTRHLVMPVYTDAAQAAVRAMQDIFPEYEVVGKSAKHILMGGGAFHCVTCNQPAV
ncbi:agmatine deiminase family protein [Woodsholea maritima]|uniref:agmatine deiminase family protein n=1 Tax=Woodsholea maritima TaxID=240237 RepID=UPI000367901E|nr:agmatine deiminase family protein [Woodsholea maritima]